jgi:hypothetical protein
MIYITEGTWAYNEKDARKLKSALQQLEGEYYGKVGDDSLFDCIDEAITRLNQLIETNPK